MGTTVEIVLYCDDEAAARQALQAAYARVAQLDRILSDYDPDSELSRLCRRSPGGRPTLVSADLLQVLDRAEQLSRRSQGAFDVTVGPLTRLWRRARRQRQLPDPARLNAALDAVGHRHLRVDVELSQVELLRAGMRLDLGGIAKGYAAGEALAVLRAHRISAVLVNAGGDIVAGGPPPNRPGWRIGVAPLEARSPPSRFVWLAHGAIATSGDAWQFVEIDGRRYSHIVDPRSGLGITSRSSVTVLAADGATADGLASAVSVLGPQAGLELVEQFPAAAALVLQREGGQLKVYQSARFSSHLISEN